MKFETNVLYVQGA